MIDPNDYKIKVNPKKLKANRPQYKRVKAQRHSQDVPSLNEQMLAIPLPSIYAELDNPEMRIASSRQMYAKLKQVAPYLIKRLVYEASNQDNSPRDRVRATEILLNKILPNLSAETLQVDSKDIQSLVIVKASNTQDSED